MIERQYSAHVSEFAFCHFVAAGAGGDCRKNCLLGIRGAERFEHRNHAAHFADRCRMAPNRAFQFPRIGPSAESESLSTSCFPGGLKCAARCYRRNGNRSGNAA